MSPNAKNRDFGYAHEPCNQPTADESLDQTFSRHVDLLLDKQLAAIFLVLDYETDVGT